MTSSPSGPPSRRLPGLEPDGAPGGRRGRSGSDVREVRAHEVEAAPACAAAPPRRRPRAGGRPPRSPTWSADAVRDRVLRPRARPPRPTGPSRRSPPPKPCRGAAGRPAIATAMAPLPVPTSATRTGGVPDRTRRAGPARPASSERRGPRGARSPGAARAPGRPPARATPWNSLMPADVGHSARRASRRSSAAAKRAAAPSPARPSGWARIPVRSVPSASARSSIRVQPGARRPPPHGGGRRPRPGARRPVAADSRVRIRLRRRRPARPAVRPGPWR